MHTPRIILTLAVCLGLMTSTEVQIDGQSMRNGISVGPAKVFDNRSLVLMLEQLQAQLETLRVIDQQKITAALGLFQGARLTELSRAVSVTGPGAPKVTTKETAGESGGLEIAERTTEQAASSAPAAPSLPDIPANIELAPTFGLQSEDVLSDQVALSYQIFNVRMLLERALSDRLLDDEPRLQVVLGFQITVDPPGNAKGKAAFVEVTVRGRKTLTGTPSLVSVMPYEKTYNSYALDRKANAFGGAAVAKVLTIGYSEQRRSETFYLFRDADTLAYSHPQPGETDGVTFGWQFRPVLGRRSVSPGVRQMFAVLSVPVADVKGAVGALSVSARTYWKKYDSKSLTTKAKEESELPSPLGELDIVSTVDIDDRLRPDLDAVSWEATDTDTVVVSVDGKNLFVGTQVLLGKTVYDSADKGLLFKSDKALELRTTMDEVAFGEAVISGRYGLPVPLAVPPPIGGSGILINSVSFRPQPGRHTLDVDVVLQARDASPLNDLPAEMPLLTVGPSVAVATFIQRTTCAPKRLDRVPARASGARQAPKEVACWRITGVVPASALEKEPLVGVKYPFRGSRWAHVYSAYSPTAISGVVRLGGDGMIRLGITGRGFEEGFEGNSGTWQVVLDKAYEGRTLEVSDTLISFEVDAKTLEKFQKLIVQSPADTRTVLDIPDGKPSAPAPTLAAGQRKSVKKETAGSVTLGGAGLTAIESVQFEGKDLQFVVGKKGAEILILLTRAVTAKSGDAVVLLQAEGTQIPVVIVVE